VSRPPSTSPFASAHAIEHIGRGLLERSLPKPEWTHAAHFAAAFWLLRQPGIDALREMPGLIRAYNEATGVPNTDSGGYHETITLASLRAARAWLAARPDMPLHEALNELLASELGRSDWLLAYWSRPLLFSVAARRAWADPDLQPLPF
jgi:hypothetical protein